MPPLAEFSDVLLEGQARLGGWVRSNRIELPQIGVSALLEASPRTLRPNGKSVLELVWFVFDSTARDG